MRIKFLFNNQNQKINNSDPLTVLDKTFQKV